MLFNEYNMKILDAASKDDTRPALTVLHVNKAETIATDSYMLARIQASKTEIEAWPQSMPKPVSFAAFNIPVEHAKKLQRNIPKTSRPVLNHFAVQTKDDARWIMLPDLEAPQYIKIPPAWDNQQCQFPKVENIAPKGDPVVEIALDPELLLRAAKILKNISKKAPVRVRLYDPLKPIQFLTESPENQELEVLIMPVRLGKEEECTKSTPGEKDNANKSSQQDSSSPSRGPSTHSSTTNGETEKTSESPSTTAHSSPTRTTR